MLERMKVPETEGSAEEGEEILKSLEAKQRQSRLRQRSRVLHPAPDLFKKLAQSPLR